MLAIVLMLFLAFSKHLMEYCQRKTPSAYVQCSLGIWFVFFFVGNEKIFFLLADILRLAYIWISHPTMCSFSSKDFIGYQSSSAKPTVLDLILFLGLLHMFAPRALWKTQVKVTIPSNTLKRFSSPIPHILLQLDVLPCFAIRTWKSHTNIAFLRFRGRAHIT